MDPPVSSCSNNRPPSVALSCPVGTHAQRRCTQSPPMDNAIAQVGTPAYQRAVEIGPVGHSRSRASSCLGARHRRVGRRRALPWPCGASQGDYKVLYANLSEKDGGAIIAQLSQMNMPVPACRWRQRRSWCRPSQVHDARLKLASAGLPKGSRRRLRADGQRHASARPSSRSGLTFQRGLEGELTRSIGALGRGTELHACTWHCRTRTASFANNRNRAASVLLTLHPGRARSSAHPDRGHRASGVGQRCPS